MSGKKKLKKVKDIRKFLGQSHPHIGAAPFKTDKNTVFCPENGKWYQTKGRMRAALKKSKKQKEFHKNKKRIVRSFITGNFYESIYVREKAHKIYQLQHTEYLNQFLMEATFNKAAKVYKIRRTMINDKGEQVVMFVDAEREKSVGVVHGD